jgi:hypothetical protein
MMAVLQAQTVSAIAILRRLNAFVPQIASQQSVKEKGGG